ncbi:cupin domain-containing protein [Petropleomorpha daqingensis]|uniref:Quercetin dioxygenase-like cupin family protein n=1 Tax=Petropleomorpha daqingensis TaxID=2026353 RepID=A0A853CH82_9ACTN|nr:cupin domain-containing protein [Petropleomorpha daqingensis]NYJ07324.1 quercetin dioxygenase-like cupin family protein [Petropleomorpha daqingensis]
MTGPAPALERTEVQRGALSVAGREVVQLLIRIPAGEGSGRHTHPGEEVGYVLAGSVEVRVEGDPPRVLQAGDGFVVPPRTPHEARAAGPGTAELLSTYLVATGEPISTPVG